MISHGVSHERGDRLGRRRKEDKQSNCLPVRGIGVRVEAGRRMCLLLLSEGRRSCHPKLRVTAIRIPVTLEKEPEPEWSGED